MGYGIAGLPYCGVTTQRCIALHKDCLVELMASYSEASTVGELISALNELVDYLRRWWLVLTGPKTFLFLNNGTALTTCMAGKHL
jgi:hypothetical protein